MRVTVVLDGLPGSSETFLRRHIEHFHADVVARRCGTDVLETASVSNELRCFETGGSGSEGLLEKIIRRGREVALGTPAPSWNGSMEAIFEQYLADREPDVVLAEFGPNAICAAGACEKHATPLVAHFHGYDASAMLRFPRYRDALTSLFGKVAAVVVVSHDMARRMERHGCAQAKIHVIPCGAALGDLDAASAVGRQPCRFLTIGRKIPVKAPEDTLLAFRALASRVPGVTLRMIGGGPLLARLRRSVRRWGLEGSVQLDGSAPWRDVRTALAGAGVFLHPSVTTPLGQVEGWGVALAEAAAAGLPVVATRSGGIPDQVVDGVTGLLVDEHDVEGMARAMEQLALDPELRQRMGLAGRANIHEVGNVQTQLAKLGDVLEQAAHGRPE